MIERMHLTSKQTKILELRLRGYDNKAIADSLGIEPDSVKREIAKIVCADRR